MDPTINWTGTNNDRTAPSYGIAPRTFVSVEHPCVVKDVEKAFATLKGGQEISKLLASIQQDTPATLTLHPEDPMSKTLLSSSKRANNVLLKITVPKRTGRKRKRGSQEPYRYEGASGSPAAVSTATTTNDTQGLDAKQLLRRLRDNVNRYQVEAVGLVERHHVFRGMPDFVFSTTGSPFVNKFRETVLSFEYPKVKEFQLDMSKGCISNADIIPSPSLSISDVPSNYFYRQNPGVKQLIDPTGQVTTINTQQSTKVLTHTISFDDLDIPKAPRKECPPVSTLDNRLQETIKVLEARFSQRLGWTRRALRNSLNTREQKTQLRWAIPYVGYNFRSGPWRDAIIKLGHDPRTDPKSRIYQTLSFRLGAETGTTNDDQQQQQQQPQQPPPVAAAQSHGASRRAAAMPRPQIGANSSNITDESATTSHIFTGLPPVYYDSRTWMILDITDPQLTPYIESLQPRPTCDSVSGWYGNVALASVRAIMRVKITHMVAYNSKFPREDDLLPLFRLPTHVESEEEVGRLIVTESQKCLSWAAEIRTTVKGGLFRQREEQEGWEDGGVGGEQKRRKVQWEDEEEEVGDELEEQDKLEEQAEQDEQQGGAGEQDEEMEQDSDAG